MSAVVPYRWIGAVVAVVCWFVLGLTFWPDAPNVVPLTVSLAIGWVGFVSGAVVEIASRRG